MSSVPRSLRLVLALASIAIVSIVVYTHRGSLVPARSTTGSQAEAPFAPRAPAVEKLCGDLRRTIERLHWTLEPCDGLDWISSEKSLNGRPLLYAAFGDPHASNTTLILAMVHGDEITPLYLSLQLAHWLKQNPSLLMNSRVVIAPLVNPDGFFAARRTRGNARGVDLNRNFPTADWESRALAQWKKRYRSNPRRYPGSAPASEPETAFQMELIKRFNPQKILSIHSPLNFVDYDGPTVLSLDKFPREYVRECLRLRSRVKAISSGFFPGSLGNYAGHELGIPTFTLELPTANPRMAETYWKKFQLGIRTVIEFRMSSYALRAPLAGDRLSNGGT